MATKRTGRAFGLDPLLMYTPAYNFTMLNKPKSNRHDQADPKLAGGSPGRLYRVWAYDPDDPENLVKGVGQISPMQ